MADAEVESRANAESAEQDAGGPTATPAAAPLDGDWRAAIPDEKLRTYAARFNTPGDLAKTALNFRQQLSNAIPLPGRNAGEQELRAFHRRLGVPDSPEGYDVSPPRDLPESLRLDEAGEARFDGFKRAMHQAGAPPAAVRAASDWYFATTAQLQAHETRAAVETREAAEASLRGEWDRDYERNLHLAQRAASEFGGEEFARFVDTAKVDGAALGDHPAFLNVFAAIGKRLGEDVPHAGGGQGGGGGGDLNSRIGALTRQIWEASERGDSAAVDRLSRERETASRKLHGSAGIVDGVERAV